MIRASPTAWVQAALARGQLAIDLAYTSQKCACRDHTAKEKCQSQRKFACLECGYTANADINGTRNILAACPAAFRWRRISNIHVLSCSCNCSPMLYFLGNLFFEFLIFDNLDNIFIFCLLLTHPLINTYHIFSLYLK